jgi:hypothetical protein
MSVNAEAYHAIARALDSFRAADADVPRAA